ncbi:hypothetical protein ACIBQ1_44765 [Nonomuraea sp. NPDC050153]|uniref:hypothetical protein n=1 Tax=Nonomuraea sp. NPDC050153 TaxID=3364359 RepID=UPI0037B034EF
MTQSAVARFEGGGTVPTLPVCTTWAVRDRASAPPRVHGYLKDDGVSAVGVDEVFFHCGTGDSQAVAVQPAEQVLPGADYLC